MRIIAIDTSGSNMHLVPRMLEHAKNHFRKPKDAVVFYDTSGVTRAVWLAEVSEADIKGGGGDGTLKLIEWMDGRSFQPTDELAVYTDGIFDLVGARQQLEKTWFSFKAYIPKDFYKTVAPELRANNIDPNELPF